MHDSVINLSMCIEPARRRPTCLISAVFQGPRVVSNAYLHGFYQKRTIIGRKAKASPQSARLLTDKIVLVKSSHLTSSQMEHFQKRPCLIMPIAIHPKSVVGPVPFVSRAVLCGDRDHLHRGVLGELDSYSMSSGEGM